MLPTDTCSSGLRLAFALLAVPVEQCIKLLSTNNGKIYALPMHTLVPDIHKVGPWTGC